MRRANILLTAPSVYPFQKPFYDTPYDQDRSSSPFRPKGEKSPAWMMEGIDGTGKGIGLYRRHPLAKRTRGNLSRTPEQIPRIFSMMTKGVWHKSGVQKYYNGGKPPNPSKHPYITGAPHPIYGWKITEPQLIKEFNTPHVSKDQVRLKPYVALHERSILGNVVKSQPVVAPEAPQEKSSKPLLKRLFFWQ